MTTVPVNSITHSCGAEISYPSSWEGEAIEQFFLLRHVLDCKDTTPDQLLSGSELYYTLLPVVAEMGGS